MKITVYEQDAEAGLLGDRAEVWVQVQADELLDWPRIKQQLTDEQRALLDQCGHTPAAYHPATLGPDDKYRFEDWFIFKRIDALA